MHARWSSSPFGRTAAQCKALVDGLVAGGLAGVVVCPGSRSTPLAVAIGSSSVPTVVGLDEREAAFFALGWARVRRAPIAVVTTSGTAALELAPAIAEARESGVPLVAIVADRPRWAHGVGAAQTLDQAPALAQVAWLIDVELSDALGAAELAGVAHEALVRATSAPWGPGPVVLNVAIGEPLLVAEQVRIGPWIPREPLSLRPGVPGDNWIERWFDPERRGWLIVGEDPWLDGRRVGELAARLGWPLFADQLARVPRGPWVLEHPELALRALPDLAPEVVVVLGAAPASRVINERVRDLARRGVPLAWLHGGARWRDPARSATTAASVDTGALVERALSLGPQVGVGDAGDELVRADRRIAVALAERLRQLASSEVAVAVELLRQLDPTERLVVASSLPIRHLDTFAGRQEQPPRVLANRGANGIDGTVATWLGAAHAAEELTALLIGDVAALYGLSAAWQLPHPSRGLVLLLENGGGLIFDRVAPARLLPETLQLPFFVTPPRHAPSTLLAQLGFVLVEVRTHRDVAEAVTAAREGSLIVARLATSRERTNAELDRLYQVVDGLEGRPGGTRG